jgi:hypothetical protein
MRGLILARWRRTSAGRRRAANCAVEPSREGWEAAIRSGIGYEADRNISGFVHRAAEASGALLEG